MYLGIQRIKSAYTHTRKFFVEHGHHMPVAALVVGFAWDSFTLNRLDQMFDNAVILFYLILVGGIIAFANYREERGGEYSLWWLVVLQFSFGNLASALFVIFGKSGTLVGSWPFLLVFLSLLVGNEFLRGQYTRLRINVAIFYLFLLSYLVLIVPVLVRAVGTKIFLASGALSLVLIVVFLGIFYAVAPTRIAKEKKHLLLIITLIFVGFNIFYFFNLIPPSPLALRDIGIYHSVLRENKGLYEVSFEKGKWYQPLKRSDSAFHLGAGGSAFCFSSVFAPARISTPIFHRWEYLDKSDNVWKTATYISFPMTGGRSNGFRGYSVKNNLFPGKWRCSVETKRGELIGRRTFTVVAGGEESVLEKASR